MQLASKWNRSIGGWVGSRNRSSQLNWFPKNPKSWVRRIRQLESDLTSITDKQLRGIADSIRQEAKEATPSPEMMTRFTSVVSEAVFRTQGIRMYDVQLRAIGACLGQNIAEMHTGEGKTVVTGSIAAVKTILRPSVHVGTKNTYLAGRDLESMESTYGLLGISFGLLPEEPNEDRSRRAYRQQIVYGPGYQFGFDYLRDQMELRNSRLNQLGIKIANSIRGNDPYQEMIQGKSRHLALIDEADSVLIDEALTPLVISVPSPNVEDPTPYYVAKKIVADFEIKRDYEIELPSKRVIVKDAANERAHQAIANERLNLARPWRIYIVNAIRANETVERNVDYVVVDDQVQIVDQLTGRIFADRTWQDGFHQAVETKEGVEIQPSRESTTQITRQRYVQLYDSLSGLTGTGASAASEFRSIYKCSVVPIPTHKPCLRKVRKPRFFASQEAKHRAIALEVEDRHRSRQPVLVGTRTIRESTEVCDALMARGLTAIVLNGIQDKDEAEIVAEAGKAGAITIATNMAGRGTDIKPDAESLEAGGLHVIGCSPNTSPRIDRQLVGRAARQGQPGSAQFFVAATDSLIAEEKMSLQKQIVRRARSNGESADFSRELSKLQDEVEARNYQTRQKMILRDFWMDTVREAIEKE